MSKNIFVIEDDPDVITLLQSIFAELNKDASFFSSSKNGLEEIIKQHPDLVIMDLMMPGVSGFDICRYIRNNPELKNTSIIVITGYDSPKMKSDIFSYGIDDYLPKPFDIKEFIEKLNRFV